MSWSPQKNRILAQRVQAWTVALQGLLEERSRLVAIVDNEATGSPDFVDTDIATLQELNGAKEVMDSLSKMIVGQAVATQSRIGQMTPFLIG